MIADVAALFAFRLGTSARSRARLAIGLVVFIGVVTCFTYLPAMARGVDLNRQEDARILLPTAFLGFLITASLAAIGSAGGRELILRDHAVAYPVAPQVDHIGALLLSPLNLAWMLQALSLMALTAYSVPAEASVVAGLLVTLVWVVTSTMVGQALSWAVEWVRTVRNGPWMVRGVGAALASTIVVLVSRGQLGSVLDDFPTRRWGFAALYGDEELWLVWARRLGELVGISIVAYAVGLAVATALARRARREESQAETRRWARRPEPVSDLAALLRSDRASVWRSVPLRRGAAVLAVLPGAVAAIGRVPWETMPVLPGLVASGAALLFGVNAWCLDGPGAWWRESLPARPRLLLQARAIVLLETVTAPMVLALVLAVARARTPPTTAEVVALGCATVVIIGQVVSRSLDWSVRRPYVADLRGARATPAPPGVMAGYSARLAVVTTFTGIAYGACGVFGRIDLSLLLTLVLSLFVARRFVGAAAKWDMPDIRARVVNTVARS